MPEEIVHGFVADRFSAVREAFEENLVSGADVGASCSVTLEGETVVDIWGGFADEARTRPWEKETIANVFSTTKPVARYWPEFAANGKERVKVSHLMSHSSGLSGMREPLTTEDLYDWEKVTS